MATQEDRPRATNAKPAQDVSAGSIKSVPIVSRPTDTVREARPTFAQRLLHNLAPLASAR